MLLGSSSLEDSRQPQKFGPEYPPRPVPWYRPNGTERKGRGNRMGTGLKHGARVTSCFDNRITTRIMIVTIYSIWFHTSHTSVSSADPPDQITPRIMIVTIYSIWFHTSHTSVSSADPPDPSFAVGRCCAKAVSYRSHSESMGWVNANLPNQGSICPEI